MSLSATAGSECLPLNARYIRHPWDRVVLVGDSQLTDTSPQRDVTKPGPRLRRRGHEVDTLAVGGLDTSSALTLLGSNRRADWTVYCFGANDEAPRKRGPPAEFATNLERLIHLANSQHLLVLGPAPVRESDAPGSRTNREAARYSMIAAAVAARHGAEFIALVDVLSPDDLADDDVHLNDHGYDVLERVVTATIGRTFAASHTDSALCT